MTIAGIREFRSVNNRTRDEPVTHFRHTADNTCSRHHSLSALYEVARARIDQETVIESAAGVRDHPSGNSAWCDAGHILQLRAQGRIFDHELARGLHPADQAFIFLTQTGVLGVHDEAAS